ncbi:hypothetical protein M378DRAFT_163882 [Amanita muscaria Koide BX008]|uniref:Uncharacterized protein n=1 Tax=Amanita muscaria (strain Koide BX008) TaxID=946122 RepID=A0A0C2TB20_AMAMK|nr:hypothetical protein M378DRAFT_163882 [Amanita muscaria Koide BX008]
MGSGRIDKFGLADAGNPAATCFTFYSPKYAWEVSVLDSSSLEQGVNTIWRHTVIHEDTRQGGG